MAPFMLYIIKLSCCLTVFYLSYKLLLSNETFFRFNRRLLLTGTLVCLLLPFVKIKTEAPGIIQQPMIHLEKIITEEVYFPQLTENVEKSEAPILPSKQPFSNLLAWVFLAGCMVNFGFLVRSHIALHLLIRRGRHLKRGDNTLVLFDKPVTPFNYGRYIILSESDYRENPDTILTHELAHFRFAHAFDLVLMELLTLLQWFNPVVYALKREVRKIHEFQADAEVLNTGVNATQYQLLLLKKAAGAGVFAFANSFNYNKLKIRIMMMSKKKSNRWARLKLFLLLPAAALCMYAFARPEVTRQLAQMIRSEETTTPPNSQKYTPEFFEAELNKFISELGGSATLSADEISKLLREKTNGVSIFINSKDAIFCTSARGKGAYTMEILIEIEELSRLLTNELIAEYQNKKPVLIYFQYDRGSSTGLIDKVFQIIGEVFTDNQALLDQKKQPVLLLFNEPKSYSPKNKNTTSFSSKLTVSPTAQITLFDNNGRSFSIKKFVAEGDSFELDKDTARELEEWLKGLKSENPEYKTVFIRGSAELPMGVIIDIKQILRKHYALTIKYASD